MGSTPGSGRQPGGGDGNPPQYSYLETPMDRRDWRAAVHGVAKSQTRLSDFTFTFTFTCDSEARVPGLYVVGGPLSARSQEEPWPVA